MFKESKFKAQRQPKRHPITAVAAIFLLGGGILTITVVGAVIGIPLLVVGGILLLIRSKIKIVSVKCPHCKFVNQIELTVRYFNCEQCSKTIRQEQGQWVSA